LLILEEKTLVTGKEVNCVQRMALVRSDSMEKVQHLRERVHSLRILALELGISDVTKTPIQRPVKIGDS
jgi:hypothetical protein